MFFLTYILDCCMNCTHLTLFPLPIRYAGGLFLMNDLIEAVTIWFNTPFLLQEVSS